MQLCFHLLLSIHLLPWFKLPWIWLSDTSSSNPRTVLLGIQTKISKLNFIIMDSNKSSSSHFPTIDVEITIFMSMQLGILENNFSFAPLFCLQISFPVLQILSNIVVLNPFPLSQYLASWFYLSSVQSLSRVQLFATPLTAAYQASLSFTISKSFLKLMSIKSVMLSNDLIFYHPLLLQPSIFPSIDSYCRQILYC